MRPLLYILLFCIFITLSYAESSGIDPTFQSVEWIASEEDSLVRLPHRFLLPNSVQIFDMDRRLCDKDLYDVNLNEGSIRFYKHSELCDTLRIYYRAFPIQFKESYKRWEPSDTTEKQVPDITNDTVVLKPVQRRQRDLPGETLRRSGSIFRGISVGTNQSMRLESGLRVQLSGNVAPGVEVIASLTDQNTPIQPEGNTQTLQEIDKVFVQVNAPHFKSTMGDYVLESGSSGFGGYSRKLQGAMVTGMTENAELSLSAGVSKGDFTTNQFSGQEGNQGPYQLTGSKGQREIIVLAGTERVWIDGERMIRGEDNDYIIEYGNGQITFTRNRLITGDSRITIDFEYSDQKFQKTVYGASGKIHLWKDKLLIETSVLREADDKENPLDIPLTEEYRNVLSRAGDDVDSALVSGAIYLGENQGEYIETTVNGKVIYQYAGAESGEYRVRFSYAGNNQGDYSFQGYGIYRYEGEGLGDYLPVIYLPLAAKHQMADLKATLSLTPHISLHTEAAVSDQDLNQYSNVDNDDNVDVAYTGSLNIQDLPAGSWGDNPGLFSLNYKTRIVGDDFRPVGRISEVEHGRKWGSEQGVVWGEDTHELLSRYRIGKWMNVQGNWGALKKGSGFQSDRRMLKSMFERNSSTYLHHQIEWIETEDTRGMNGSWLRQSGDVSLGWKGWIPSFTYEGEHRKDEDSDSLWTGFLFHDWKGRFTFRKLGGLWEFSESIREDQKYISGSLQDYSTAKTDRFSWTIQRKSGFSSTLQYTNRFRDYVSPSLEDQQSNLADAKLNWSPPKGILSTSMNYQFSSTQVSEMVRDTIEVGRGLGEYRFDENLQEFVPDPDGDLIFRMIQTGEFIPVNALRSSFEFRFYGDRAFQKSRGFIQWMRAVETRTQIRFDRKDRERNFAKVNERALNPNWGNDSTLVTGLVSLFQDVEYRPKGKSLSVRLRYRKDDSENRQLVHEGTIRYFQEISLRIKNQVKSGIGYQFEYEYETDDKDYISTTRQDRDIQSHLFQLETSYKPGRKWDVALKVKIRQSKDFFPDPITEANAYFLIPRFGMSIRQKGRLRTEFEWGHVSAEPSGRTLPYEMLQGDQPGRTMRWTVFFTYRLSSNVMATLNYRARKEPWRDQTYQTGQVEVRAFF